MALCPDGHQSDATDYCDECGLAIGAVSVPTARPAAGGGAATSSSRPGDPCPNCLLPREQSDPFCEGCGFDFASETGYPTASTPRASFDLDAELRKAEEEARRLTSSGAPHPPVPTSSAGAQGGGSSGGVSGGYSTGLSGGPAGTGAAGAGAASGWSAGSGSSGPVSSGSVSSGSVSSGSAPSGNAAAVTESFPSYVDPAYSTSGQPGYGPGGPANGGGATGTAAPATPPPTGSVVPAAGRWSLVARADRVYYDSVVAEGEIDPVTYPFPPYCPERRFTLGGDTLRIGRSSSSRGAVEVDLTGPPTDPGVSHLHAVLQARPGGGWTVLDPGSTNGTVLNDDTAPIPPNQAVEVEPGFRIHVGVWTTLTLVLE